MTQRFIMAGFMLLAVSAGLYGFYQEYQTAQQVNQRWADGEQYAAAGQLEQAIEHYDAALALRQNRAAIRFNRAEAYAATEQYEQSLADFETLLQTDTGWLAGVERTVFTNGALLKQLQAQQAAYPDLTAALQPRARQRMGLNIDPKNDRGRPSMSELQAMGVVWVRFTFKGNDCDSPLDTTFSFYDPYIRRLNEAGIDTLLILNYETCPGKPAYEAHETVWRAYTSRFVQRSQQIAAHYGDQIRAYQIWNEPDFATALPEYDPRVLPQRFAPLMAETYQRIKSVSEATVVMGGLNSSDPNWLIRMRGAQSGLLSADVVALHLYGQRPQPDWPSRAWGFGEAAAMIQRYHRVTDKPLWITEVGVHTDDNRLQADYMARFYSSMLADFPDAVERTFWFAYSDGMVSPFGLLDPFERRKPAYQTYQTLALARPDARSGYATSYLTHNTPLTMTAGQTATVTITLRNDSYRTWIATGPHQIRLGYHWFNQNGSPTPATLWNDNRTALPQALLPNEQITLKASLHAPTVTGSYRLRWSLVEELQTWFDWQGVSPLAVSVTVTCCKEEQLPDRF